MSKELLKALTDVLDDLKLRKNLSEDDAMDLQMEFYMLKSTRDWRKK